MAKKEEDLLTEKDLNAREKDFLKVFNFAFDRGYRRTEHPFGALLQKGRVGINMQGIFVWTQTSKKSDKNIVFKWVRVFEYKENSDEFIKKIQELDK